MLTDATTTTASAAPVRPRIVPTADQLLAAYDRRKRATWPDGYDAAMAEPLYAALVRMEAVRQILADAKAARRAELGAKGRLPWPAGLRALPTAADRKRLAAGDTDDDR